MAGIQIFVSHSSKYADIAKSLKLSLQALDSSDAALDIKLSEEMEGSADWRQWIEQNVRGSDVFLLVYPHASMDMGWCNYELGRFYDKDRRIVCIRNTDIPKPPPAFEPYQAYDASEEGLGKFIRELFVEGTYTKAQPLNARIGKVQDDYFKRARDVARELSEQFAEARVREQLYERRIVVSVRYDGRRQFDEDASTVQGNAEGLSLLGLGATGDIKWSSVRRSLGPGVEWPLELQRVMSTMAVGVLPPALPPFRTTTGIYIPVITKSESVDGVLRQVALIFVSVDERCLRPLLNWALPPAMPESMKGLVRMVRLMFAARWEILEPRYQEAAFRAPSDERCAEMAREVLAGYEQMRVEYERDGMDGLDKFFEAFDMELQERVEELLAEWVRLVGEMGSTPSWNAVDIKRMIGQLRGNNAGWLQVAARQFTLTVARLATTSNETAAAR